MHPTSQYPTNQRSASRRSLPIALFALALAAGTASAVWAPKDEQSPRPSACAEAVACPLAGATCDGTTEDAAADAWRRKAGQPTQSDIWVARPAQGQGRVAPRSGAQPGVTTRQFVVITENNNGQECQVRIEGDRIVATRNGQPVPDRLVRRDNDRIIVSDDDGQEVMVVRISPDGRSFSTGRGAGAGAIAGGRNVIIRRQGHPGGTFEWRGQQDDADQRVRAHGRVVIDTGDGEPRVFEFDGLDGLREHMGTLREHLRHLEGVGNLREHLQHLGAPEGMHRFLIELQDGHGLNIEGLDLDSLDLGDLGINIEAEVLGEVQDAMRSLNIDLGDLNEEFHLNFAPRADAGDNAALSWQPATPSAPAQPPRRPNVRVQRAPEPPPAPSAPPVPGASQPRAMIGIVMGDVPEDTAERLHLGEGAGFRIERVIEGLPAAEAGLEEGVVVVAIDGRSPATTMLLREIMGDKEPGDILTLQVVGADGQRRAVEIELAPFRQDALEITTTTVGPSGTYSFMFDEDDTDDVRGDVSRDISAMIEALTRSDVGRLDPDELRDRIQAIVRHHMAANAGAMAPRRLLVAPDGNVGQGQMMFVEPPPAPRAPAAPGAGNAALERRVNELAERLANLEQRLDRLTRALENRQRD